MTLIHKLVLDILKIYLQSCIPKINLIGEGFQILASPAMGHVSPRFPPIKFFSSLWSCTKSIATNSIRFPIVHLFENVWNWQKGVLSWLQCTNIVFVFSGGPTSKSAEAGQVIPLPILHPIDSISVLVPRFVPPSTKCWRCHCLQKLEPPRGNTAKRQTHKHTYTDTDHVT